MVRRYWPENGYDSVMREFATMKESPHGAYVDYADYRELAKRCEKLEAALSDAEGRLYRLDISKLDAGGRHEVDVLLDRLQTAMAKESP